MTRYFYNLRVRLILVVLLATLPALALTLYSGFEQRGQAAEQAQSEALQLVRFAAVNHELLIENSRGLLIALSHSLAQTEQNLRECGSIFSHIQETHFPFYSAFYIGDLEGNILCTMPHGDVPLDLWGCEHYQALLVSEEFVVSQYHICRNTGKAVVSIGAPVIDIHDEVKGVVNVSLDLSWFNQLAHDAPLPEGATLTLIDRQGTILAHYPESKEWLGSPMGADTIAPVVLSQKEGTAEGKGIDGAERLFAFTSLEGSEDGVFVAVGIPTKLAFAEANRTITRNLSLLGMVTVLAILAAWFLGEVFVMRQADALVKTTQKIAGGDLEARAEIPYEQGEFGLLAASIDEMADSLARRAQEQKLAEEATKAYARDLERSNKDLMDFANIASHDLQEPLRKIQIFGDLLKTRYSDELDEQATSYVDNMRNSANRMQKFLVGLLTYSRISTRGQPFSDVDLNQVLQAVLDDLEVTIARQGAVIDISHLPTIPADATQMHQLFQNLLSNAIKFQSDSQAPKISIRAKEITSSEAAGEKEDRTWQLSVSDNGIGFNEKYLDRIFLPFQRLHGRTRYEGTGMGLAICRKIVERHRGRIHAESIPGQGTTFFITFNARP